MNLDKVTIEAVCPKCRFYNPFFIKQARLQDVIICRGCHLNIQLSDQMAECQKVIRRLEKEFNDLIETIKNISPIHINIKL